jgi:sugar/nucleoside kinase (ribokinase family)
MTALHLRRELFRNSRFSMDRPAALAAIQYLRGNLQKGQPVPSGVFVGLSTVDIVYGVDEFPSANTKIAAHSQNVYAGGPAANAAIAFAHLGGEATLVTAVGTHPLAGIVADEMRRNAVQLIDLNPDFDQTPAISSVTVNAKGERNVVSANATRISTPPAQIDEPLLRQAAVVMVDGHHMQACQAWASAARALGMPVVLDGGSWKQGADELLKSVDTAICSADFMPPGCASEPELIAYLQTRGVANIAISRGPEPIQFIFGGQRGTVPIVNVDVVDTMGAGDILHGALCYYLSMGHALDKALEEASKLATESCRFHGPREWMTRLREPGNESSPARA